jgi:hypothetical protein
MEILAALFSESLFDSFLSVWWLWALLIGGGLAFVWWIDRLDATPSWRRPPRRRR